MWLYFDRVSIPTALTNVAYFRHQSYSIHPLLHQRQLLTIVVVRLMETMENSMDYVSSDRKALSCRVNGLDLVAGHEYFQENYIQDSVHVHLDAVMDSLHFDSVHRYLFVVHSLVNSQITSQNVATVFVNVDHSMSICWKFRILVSFHVKGNSFD